MKNKKKPEKWIEAHILSGRIERGSTSGGREVQMTPAESRSPL